MMEHTHKTPNQLPRWNPATKQLVAAMLVILVGLFIYIFRSLLPPIIFSALIAYILTPIVDWLSRHLRIGRGLTTGLLYLVGLGLITAAPALSVSTIVEEFKDLEINFASIVNQAILWVEQFNAMEIEFAGYVFVLPEIDIPNFDMQEVLNLLQDTVSTVAGGAVSVALTVASGVGWIMFMAFVTFYMIVDANRMGPAILSLVPPAYQLEISKLGHNLNRTWNAFLRGQLILCTVIGIVTWAAMTAMGIPYSIALGIVAGVLEIVPNLGPTLSSVPAILIALVQGSAYISMPNWGLALLVALVYWLIQNLENNLLVPRILGASLNLHPLATIIGVLAGATLGGILGALLAAPVLASLRDIVYYLYCKIIDREAFPDPPTFAERIEVRSIRALLFDLDGTLLNSDDMAVERWATRLRPVAFLDKLYNSKRMARRLIMALETPMNAMITLLDILRLDGMVLSMGEWLRKVSAQQSPHRFQCVEGTIELIQSMSERYDLGIVTTRNREDTRQFLERFGLKDMFKVIVTRQDVKRLKPHPESVRYAAEKLGCLPEQCIMIGDTTVDVHAGKKAGALTVAVLCGFGERPELARLKPDLILDTTAELGSFLKTEAALGVQLKLQKFQA